MPVEHDDMQFEGRLSHALHDLGGGFDADRAALADAGQARGRRLRLRRRAAIAGGAAGIALVGVSAAVLVPWGGTPAPQPSSVATKPKPSASAYTPVSGKEMIQTLQRLLPKGEFSQGQGRGTDNRLPPSATVVYDDGKGAAALSLSLNKVQPGGREARDAVQCPAKAYIAYDSCKTSRLADGSVVMVFQGYEYPDRRVDTKRWTADLITPTGQHVSVSEWNAPSEKDAPVSRVEPPLNPAQLTRLAAAQEWRGIVNAIPPDPHQPTAEPEDPEVGLHARTTLLGLLPKGLKVVDKSTDDGGFAYAVLDDGKGKSLVQVNVQPGMSDVAGQLFDSGDETLPDGTRVAVHQGPGEKGGAGVVMWTVDTLRTDGRRVMISAFNSGTQNDAATRDTPALTIAQMREMALSPQWFSAR
jgi:hypothetical protein